jgi:hypothetical protein
VFLLDEPGAKMYSKGKMGWRFAYKYILFGKRELVWQNGKRKSVKSGYTAALDAYAI